MALLPFVVQPKKNVEIVRIGNEDIGVFEIERKGYLTVAEKSFVENVMQGSDGVASMVQLANRVAQKYKTTTENAYLAVGRVLANDSSGKLESKIAAEYSEELAVLTSRLSESMQRRSIACATILLQTRVNQEWAFEDTLGLDPEIVSQLSDLYDREERREEVKKVSEEDEAKEIVGK